MPPKYGRPGSVRRRGGGPIHIDADGTVVGWSKQLSRAEALEDMNTIQVQAKVRKKCLNA